MASKDMSSYFNNHPYILEAKKVESTYSERREFHTAMEPLLVKMGSDKAFLSKVIERNINDLGWLNFDWSDYNIPFFYVYETDDFILKIHLFPAGPEGMNEYAAHAIHHHNNYLLTTYAFFGSGYESILFKKDPKVNEKTMASNLKVNKHFHQKDWNPSRVDSWEPHIVFLPASFSATFLMWSPDVKRKTDALRNSSLLKPFKKELRHLIYKLGMGDKLGIAREKTYQFYVKDKQVFAIDEVSYFSPSRSANGQEQKAYAMQMLFSFFQKSGLASKEMIQGLKDDTDTPAYFQPWMDRFLAGEQIPEVMHRHELNIPNKTYTREDILAACS